MGKHTEMTAWSTDDDDRLLQLQIELGKNVWTAIASKMPGRSVASVRNRVFRIDRGNRLVQEGKGKNRCTRCGEMKRGHACRYKIRADNDNHRTGVVNMLTSMRLGLFSSSPCSQQGGFDSLNESNELEECVKEIENAQ